MNKWAEEQLLTMYNTDKCKWNQRVPAESYIIRTSGNSSQKTGRTSKAITGRDVHKYCMNRQSSSRQNDSNVRGGCHSSLPWLQGCLRQSAGWGIQWLRGRKRGCLEWLDRLYQICWGVKKSGITGSQGKICLVRTNNKNKKSGVRFGQPCLASLPHGSDQEGKKQRKSIGRRQGNNNVH